MVEKDSSRGETNERVLATPFTFSGTHMHFANIFPPFSFPGFPMSTASCHPSSFSAYPPQSINVVVNKVVRVLAGDIEEL
ncbi:hypothetical protein GYMLUDRAFT_47406 [Collybiopsis luxurians FD-317 M1]|uniref:Uncharacterized protein n=1 Tax=Collybiopsis luxurians FD-317 M1 TaxID=944289 RepID=A0A0D0CDQ3_9AGAR|nr:hypothetical protein GYMLUDRAFT_47406 [Collybiopsis luxurians FD-317 M1]